MVGLGYAWEDSRFSNGHYALGTENAIKEGGFVHTLDCIPPWEWRERG